MTLSTTSLIGTVKSGFANLNKKTIINITINADMYFGLLIIITNNSRNNIYYTFLPSLCKVNNDTSEEYSIRMNRVPKFGDPRMHMPANTDLRI